MDTAHFWDCLHASHHEVNDWYLTAEECIRLLMPVLLAASPQGRAEERGEEKGGEGVSPATKSPLPMRCLHMGCGTSSLGDELSKVYDRVVNVDFSEECIRYQRGRRPEDAYEVADARAMPEYHAGSFGVIIDKGTLDSLQRDVTVPNMHTLAALAEFYRLLSPGGTLVSISIIKPEYRKTMLEAGYKELGVTTAITVAEWSVSPFEMPDQPAMWAYVISYER